MVRDRRVDLAGARDLAADFSCSWAIRCYDPSRIGQGGHLAAATEVLENLDSRTIPQRFERLRELIHFVHIRNDTTYFDRMRNVF